jgi:protocatechuate 3,4-dioxygenase beta subunit
LLLNSASTLLSSDKALTKTLVLPPDACTLSETECLFLLDLTTNSFYFRKAVSETKTGVPLTVKPRIIGASNCLPMKNVRVNIWHCDKYGIYSGYAGGMNQGDTADSTFCPGYQFTDNDGVATFTTIFPGWYSGRVCHIHFKVTVSTSYAAVSQLSFQVTEKNALYTVNPTLYTKGADPQSIATHNIFSDGYATSIDNADQKCNRWL